MKRLILLALPLLLGLAACQHKEIPQARLKTKLDTLAYCLGASQAPDRVGIGQMLANVHSDSTRIEDFLSGLYEGLSKGAEAYEANKTDAASLAYNQGISIGIELLDRSIARTEHYLQLGDSLHLPVDEFAAAFADVVHGKISLLVGGKPATREQLSDIGGRLMETVADERAEALYGAQKRAGLDYIAQKTKEEGVRPLQDGIYYKELQTGHGAKPTASSTVQVRYEGRFIDGKVFDATANHGTNEYDEFKVGQVIKGWQKALAQMPVGAKWEVYIPYDQAYGPAGNPPDMPPYSTLIFTMELIAIK
ncbi:MAG: FKBP-type peptidyl-prolyl cis-trans isomerase [Bacteroidaceae bacterium]|nr:FKBP-type peptidyl-prolyl cis-trans isomerase [Bacteroidaceae bacterium]